jgi:hypothetical protein
MRYRDVLHVKERNQEHTHEHMSRHIEKHSFDSATPSMSAFSLQATFQYTQHSISIRY